MSTQAEALTAADRPIPLRGRGLGTYAMMPAFLVAVCLLLWLYISSIELDAIEVQRVNREFITTAILQHTYLVAISTVLVIALAVPVGIMLTRPFARHISTPLLAVFNAGQAIPSVGVIILLALTLGFGPGYAITALVIYAFLPVLRNTMVGLAQVDAATIEAARGMGMTKLRVLRRIELPLAVPVILAGVRTALVINVGTAAVATLTNAGGLGDIIYVGLIQNRDVMKIVGGVLTGVLALTLDYIAGIAEEVLRPRGL
ncbi:ABC transporter permease [soil metagenome]